LVISKDTSTPGNSDKDLIGETIIWNWEFRFKGLDPNTFSLLAPFTLVI